ncbi:Tapetum-specific protein A9 [Cardamine amara subsp. amara]|uniref:Tapetum-specific protein A9 n=1 Tax=Cardamine amara subsp. amara TaxID=228776 RepID=A0ABD1AAQ2_CARAN
MESFKPLAAVLGVLFLAMTAIETGPVVQAQECGNDLANVQVCAAMVLPGSGRPNSECCAALQSTNRDCLCNALRAATSLPSLCNLPPVNCGISA